MGLGKKLSLLARRADNDKVLVRYKKNPVAPDGDFVSADLTAVKFRAAENGGGSGDVCRVRPDRLKSGKYIGVAPAQIMFGGIELGDTSVLQRSARGFRRGRGSVGRGILRAGGHARRGNGGVALHAAGQRRKENDNKKEMNKSLVSFHKNT